MSSNRPIVFRAIGGSPSEQNTALYAQQFTMPIELASLSGASVPVTIGCCKEVHTFHAFKNDRGAVRGLPQAISAANAKTMRAVVRHMRDCHPQQAKGVVSRKRSLHTTVTAAAAYAVPSSVMLQMIQPDDVDDSDVMIMPVSKRVRLEAKVGDLQPHLELHTQDGAHMQQLMVQQQQQQQMHQMVMQQQQQHLLAIRAAEEQRNSARLHLILPPTAMVDVVPLPIGAPMVDPALRNYPRQPVQLPAVMQFEFVHPRCGPHQIWALLLWVDQCDPLFTEKAKDLSQHTIQDELFYLPHGKATVVCARRGLYLHQIVHITPLGSPLANMIGQMYSSFHKSAAHLGGIRGGALGLWHLVHQPKVTAACMIAEQGFALPNVAGTFRAPASVHLDMVVTDEVHKPGVPLLTTCLIHSTAQRAILAERSKMRHRTNNDDNEDEPLEPDAVPEWVPHKHCKAFEHLCNSDELRSCTFRDILASQCQLECDEFHCCADWDVILLRPNTCAHGHTHNPYKKPDLEECETEDFQGNKVKTMRVKENALAFLPCQSDKMLLTRDRRGQNQVGSTEWSRRIQWDSIHTRQRLAKIRIFGSTLVQLSIESLVYNEGASEALYDLCDALKDAQVVDTTFKLDEMARFDTWWPMGAEVETRRDARQNILPGQWRSMSLTPNYARESNIGPTSTSNRSKVQLGKTLLKRPITAKMLAELRKRHPERVIGTVVMKPHGH